MRAGGSPRTENNRGETPRDFIQSKLDKGMLLDAFDYYASHPFNKFANKK